MNKDFISITDFKENEILDIYKLTDNIKENPAEFSQTLKDKTIGLLFEKPSLRTRVSFEVGILQLGGKALYLSPREVQLGNREAVSDVAKTISKYLDGVIIRTFAHQTILKFTKAASIPVVNGLTDSLHPAQALSDLYTIYKKKGTLKGLKVSFIGDGNNVCNSLILGTAQLGMQFYVASPAEFSPDKDIVNQAREIGKNTGAKLEISSDPKIVAEKSDVLYTDVWTSMGQEDQRQQRIEVFKEFQVNSELCKRAKKDCIVMHCLPAHRSEEITSQVIDGPNSVVFEQAENRLYVQKAVLTRLLKGEL